MGTAERTSTTDDRQQTTEVAGSRKISPGPVLSARLISRRRFLSGLLAGVGAGLLAACTPGRALDQPFAGPYNTATPAQVLASPRAPQATPSAEEGTPQAEGGLTLQQFLMLSAALTGIDNLNPAEGQVYLQSLQASDEFDVTLAELFEQTSDVSKTSDVSGEGIFDSEAIATLADTIIEYWYTGIYTTPDGEQAVATYVDALAWKALSFTKPNSICASLGFWEERPEVTP